MNKYIGILFIFISVSAFGQAERKLIRSGNKLYDNKKFTEAEIDYRKAVDKKNNSLQAGYNIGNALYKQGKYEEASKQFLSMLDLTKDKNQLSKIHYNLGNSYFQAKKLQESANAYKSALRTNPNDKDAKFNLSLVQRMMKEQQQKDQQNKDQDKQEPSEYAKKLKLQAEKLVSERKYKEAHNLMIEGEKRDKTVQLFKDFTNRILDIIKING